VTATQPAPSASPAGQGPILDVRLWPAGEGRRAACVHVRDGHPELVRQAPAAPVVEDAPAHRGWRGPGNPEGVPR
jgi:hypothetical protein